MSTYTQIIYQIVFSTKHRNPVLTKDGRKRLNTYIWSLLENKRCHPYMINGVEDHIHIVASVHPTIALSNLIKDIKVSSSEFIKEEVIFPGFDNWQVGYGAFTYSIKEIENLIKYVANQEEHHKKESFRDEYIRLIQEHGIEFDEKYLF
ncbi:MAG: IS200/IS605 family transposase [Moheibacter sp.]